MELNARQKEILSLVQQQERVSVQTLAQTLYVSEMTVRRDLAQLEQAHLLTRYHGGALAMEAALGTPITVRAHYMDAEKRALARKAAPFLRDGAMIFFDSSSTVSYLIPYVRAHSGIRAVTNSVRNLLVLAEHGVPTVLLGGEYYEHDMCLMGELANRAAEELNVDIAFFSVLGYADGRFTDPDATQLAVRRHIMKHAGECIMLMDSSKIGAVYPYTFCKAEEMTRIIT